jgi:seryl-tRNA synthetase
LPVNAWVELCLEVKNELIESVKTRETLDNCLSKLEELKLEKMQLESKIEDNNRNKMVNDKKLSEALHLAGKVPSMEDTINEFKKKIEKYNTTIDNLREQLDIVNIIP